MLDFQALRPHLEGDESRNTDGHVDLGARLRTPAGQRYWEAPHCAACLIIISGFWYVTPENSFFFLETHRGRQGPFVSSWLYFLALLCAGIFNCNFVIQQVLDTPSTSLQDAGKTRNRMERLHSMDSSRALTRLLLRLEMTLPN